MNIVERERSPDFLSNSTVKQFVRTAVNIAPKLYHIDEQKVVKVVESGSTADMKSNSLLSFISETAASFSSQSYDYSLLSGRLEMIRLYNNTPDSFTNAMLSLKNILDDSFLKKIKAYDYSRHIIFEEDFNYDIIGVRTLQRSYLLKNEDGEIVERPQFMLMRVAIFLNETLDEILETYDALRLKYYTHASPTLFHCGMKHHQLASCFLLPIEDDSIEGIFNTIKTCALISKSAGGIGFSCSNVRATGSNINGTNGTSNGLVPMLKVLNHTARYVDQGGGKRKGAFACFLEPWHADIMSWLSLKLNHGVEEERARDLFYALWTTDNFMEAVEKDEDYYLFSPSDVPQLQDLYGEKFNKAYKEAVEKKLYLKKVKAREIWSLVCKVQIETGNPYILYKDEINKKTNQANLGTIKSSNLCAEICEFNSKDETAVCTLASICLPKFVEQNGFNFMALESCARLVCRNLNHVIDKTSYPVESAKRSNEKHRPMGVGVQGLSDVFQKLNIAYDSPEAAELNEKIFEHIYYGAMVESVDQARKFGAYESFEGSPLSKGLFQFDLWNVTPKYKNWELLRDGVKKYGARNSLLVALMPTASTAQINGNTESFEPRTSNLYVRRVLSGEFMIINKYLESVCRKLKVWNEKLVNQIIKDRGSVQNTTLPENVKKVYKTVWEMSNKTLIDLSAGRAPYVCQSQSLNLYLANPSEGAISSMQFYAWKKKLKTGQYYLRTRPKANAVQFSVAACESCSA